MWRIDCRSRGTRSPRCGATRFLECLGQLRLVLRRGRPAAHEGVFGGGKQVRASVNQFEFRFPPLLRSGFFVRRPAALEDLRADPVIRQVCEVHPVLTIKRIGGALRLQPDNRQRIVAAQIHQQVRQQDVRNDAGLTERCLKLAAPLGC